MPGTQFSILVAIIALIFMIIFFSDHFAQILFVLAATRKSSQ